MPALSSTTNAKISDLSSEILDEQERMAQAVITTALSRRREEKGQVKQETVAKFGAVLKREGLSMQRYAALYQTISADQER